VNECHPLAKKDVPCNIGGVLVYVDILYKQGDRSRGPMKTGTLSRPPRATGDSARSLRRYFNRHQTDTLSQRTTKPQRPILIAPVHVLSQDCLATAVCAHSTDTLSLNGSPLATAAHPQCTRTLSRPPSDSGLRSGLGGEGDRAAIPPPCLLVLSAAAYRCSVSRRGTWPPVLVMRAPVCAT
jgi:hypothetical protein